MTPVDAMCTQVGIAAEGVEVAKQRLDQALKHYQQWDLEARMGTRQQDAAEQVELWYEKQSGAAFVQGAVGSSHLDAYRTVEPDLTRAYEVVVLVEKRTTPIGTALATLTDYSLLERIRLGLESSRTEIGELIGYVETARSYVAAVIGVIDDHLHTHAWSGMAGGSVLGRLLPTEDDDPEYVAHKLNGEIATCLSQAHKWLTYATPRLVGLRHLLGDASDETTRD